MRESSLVFETVTLGRGSKWPANAYNAAGHKPVASSQPRPEAYTSISISTGGVSPTRAKAGAGDGAERVVITEDSIPAVVEAAHEHNGHAGWDGTWRDISTSYYGILRSDVIFLLRRCQICAHNPSKRPKSSIAMPADSKAASADSFDFADFAEWGHHEFGPNASATPT
ncbi:hypothetical protein N8T08_009775 [Aspergillus melleus]|uniref:Uncharacterized protein n=1 Tax=Aspergillus melleus TaxID=138277 RepID=A0ACC3ASX1_9EURO|nr:hypothetical protein N8T08_009775 [Aspergillus melleus]